MCVGAGVGVGGSYFNPLRLFHPPQHESLLEELKPPVNSVAFNERVKGATRALIHGNETSGRLAPA